MTAVVVAAGVGWASILAARVVPFERYVSRQGLGLVGAASLVAVALLVVDAGLPPWIPWVVVALAAGAVVAREHAFGRGSADT